MYKITLPFDLSGTRYGMDFFRGVGTTTDQRIAEMLIANGLRVEKIPEPDIEPIERKRRGKNDEA